MRRSDPRQRRRPAAALALLCILPPWAVQADDNPQLAAADVGTTAVLSVSRLEPTDRVIRRILIENGNIFDMSDPEEDGFFHRVLNAAHVRTREEIIRRQLLIEPGQPYRSDDLAETERLLRSNDYLSEAQIVPVSQDQGYVDLAVRTRDTWSLTPSVSFSRKGGENTGGFGIKESNLFGTGTELGLAYHSGIDRDSVSVHFHDNQLGATRLRLSTGYADNSDGSMIQAALEQPFFALDTRRAGGLRVEDFDQVDSLYRLGEVDDSLRHRGRRMEAWYGWSDGLRNDWARRLSFGLAYDEHLFSQAEGEPPPADLPQDRRLVYPFVGVEWIEDRYATTRNQDRIQEVEDRHLGARLAARLGYASTALGSDTGAWLTTLSASRGFRPGPGEMLLANADFEGRTGGALEDAYRLEAGLRYYHRHSDKRLFFGELRSAAVANPDPDLPLTLGGDTGLRAYPVRYQTGTTSALLTLEERWYTDWYPFHLFRVGGAVFVDAGRTWGGDESADMGLLSDVGLGLRIGSPHSSSGRMLHIDLAWPMSGPEELRGAQLVLETRKHF